ncbi:MULTISPECIES: hypothetical protein [Bradyrhizobium]|jgi:hypothetical protein|uniref:Uncharacterized protein n=1 Tax=Bradyrhizobium denitrificans TaxID=2734912 RepID=A0ABS5G9W2_9BRAD|nr:MULTISPECIES: hypothetical protein [Bradyrhizobium]MBR1138125.1 hypothetical protein [Bradyrhizobium denitrificans]MDU0954995.1 hypothetical protein [Bradyrhizobium sp.]MDU1497443.1 hypothetical protein [Bradyrhizobium sp.]MDU1547671.1 hypothetical protein [Bradyrhizobium sp.]MDU1667228.1 hypothetical protein [Bradyrhizobium sp.]
MITPVTGDGSSRVAHSDDHKLYPIEARNAFIENIASWRRKRNDIETAMARRKLS